MTDRLSKNILKEIEGRSREQKGERKLLKCIRKTPKRYRKGTPRGSTKPSGPIADPKKGARKGIPKGAIWEPRKGQGTGSATKYPKMTKKEQPVPPISMLLTPKRKKKWSTRNTKIPSETTQSHAPTSTNKFILVSLFRESVFSRNSAYSRTVCLKTTSTRLHIRRKRIHDHEERTTKSKFESTRQ